MLFGMATTWPSKRHVITGCLAALNGLCPEQQACLLCLHTPKLMQAPAADGSLHSVKQRCVLHTYAVHLNTLIAAFYASLRDLFNRNEVPHFCHRVHAPCWCTLIIWDTALLQVTFRHRAVVEALLLPLT